MQFYIIPSGKHAVCVTLTKLVLLQEHIDGVVLQILMHASSPGACWCDTPPLLSLKWDDCCI